MNLDFNSRWRAWQQAYARLKKSYNEDIWSNVADDPLDKVLDELADIALGTKPEEGLLIEQAIKKHKIEAWDLTLYVRRAGLRLEQEKHIELLERALAIVGVCSNYEDPRDMLVSLTLLIAGLRKSGISIEKYTEKMGEIKALNARELLNKAFHQSDRSISLTVQTFGPPDWQAPRKI